MTFSQFNIRVNIWTLVDQKLAGCISNPKMLPPKGLSFSKNKKFAALAEKKDGKERVSIYYAGNKWDMVNQIDLETVDLQDI